MTTAKEIEELLRPYGLSLMELPVPSKDGFAYEEADRTKLKKVAIGWEGKHFFKFEDTIRAREDFMCHQSDVIELLCSALKWANHKLGV